jgi:hypothetical protein
MQKITCKGCGYVAEIPREMSPSMYCEWHNWLRQSRKLETGHGLESFCSQCHAQVPSRKVVP